MKICKHPPCTEPAAARGFCRRHYYQHRSGRALTRPTPNGTPRAEHDRIAEGWRKQGGRCAACDVARVEIRLHLQPDGEVVCDVCKAVLQVTEEPTTLESILLYLLDVRERRRAEAQA